MEQFPYALCRHCAFKPGLVKWGWTLGRWWSLTHSDGEGAPCLHQAVGGGDDPQLTDNGAPTEQLAAGTRYQGYLVRGEERSAENNQLCS